MEEPSCQIEDLTFGIKADNLGAAKMAEGTCVKQMESRMEARMRQYQEQVEDRLDLLELGIRNMQGGIGE